MIYFTVHCDPLPGKEEELDRLLANSAKSYWLSQPGVNSFHVYGDKLVGWPERTIMIEVNDLTALQPILETLERKRVRKEFMSLVSRTESQIQDIIV
jgi:hypothetical protein